jgi:hypothetical protein
MTLGSQFLQQTPCLDKADINVAPIDRNATRVPLLNPEVDVLSLRHCHWHMHRKISQAG